MGCKVLLMRTVAEHVSVGSGFFDVGVSHLPDCVKVRLATTGLDLINMAEERFDSAIVDVSCAF